MSIKPIAKEDREIWEKAKAAHEAVGKILDALENVSPHERARILNYCWDKYVVHPDPK